MIISVSGYGYSGSGAVLDLLKEYNNLEVKDIGEVRLLDDPHGIGNLENNLIIFPTRHGSDAAIKAFIRYINILSKKNGIFRYYNKIFSPSFKNISLNYINNLINLSFKGCWHNDVIETNFFNRNFKYRIYPKFVNIFNKLSFNVLKVKPYNKINHFMHVDFDNFLIYTRKYIDDLTYAGLNNKNCNIVLDQFIPSMNPEKYLNYVNDCKCIIVDRDPRDVYLLAKKYVSAPFIPSDNISNYIKWYKFIRSKSSTNSNNILNIHFESLIYDYDKTKNLIENFLFLNNSKISSKNKIFNPLNSIGNTQLFLLENNMDEKNNIIRIEQELKEYLFDFNKYGNININRKNIF